MAHALLAGIDFTCAPSKRKPVTLATGRFAKASLIVESLEALTTLDAFDGWLRTRTKWMAAFDFPFGLPRAFVDANHLGASAAEVTAEVHRRCPTRMAWRAFIDAWVNAQPAGARLPHRRTDAASDVSSTSPLQSRYVPVAFMYFEGFARIVESGAHVPGLREGDPSRIALEGYPRRLAHAVIGRRSYKNSALPDRADARRAVVDALMQGHASLGFSLRIEPELQTALIDDPTGDRLDAVLCLAQAAFASSRPGFGVPRDVDVVEGWIVGA